MQFLFNMRPTHFLSCRLGCNIHIHFHSIPKDLQDLSVHAALPCDFQVSRASCRKTSIIHANENHRTHALSINSEMRQPTVVSGYNNVQFILRKEIAIERITSQARSTRMYFDCLFLTNPLSPPLSTIHHPRPVSLQRFRIFASARDTYLNSRRAWPQVHSVKDIYLYGVNFCISLASLWTELNQLIHLLFFRCGGLTHKTDFTLNLEPNSWVIVLLLWLVVSFNLRQFFRFNIMNWNIAVPKSW